MLAFRLAARLGMTVRQLLASIDAAELVEWNAYMRLEQEEIAVPPPEQTQQELLTMAAFLAKRK